MYARINWKDHVVTRPHTYTKVTNGDGSETFTASPGEVLQQGTPQSATNFNRIEEALQHIALAYDMMLTMYQAELRDAQTRIVTLETQVAALVEAATPASET